MERLRNSGVYLVSLLKALFSADARHLQMQLTALAIVYVVRTYWTGLDLIQEIVPSIN